MPRFDAFDISHHNTITNPSAVPDVMLAVHKVNEGRAVDRRFAERMPWMRDRFPRWGGYTVLIVSTSTIREQVENYVRLMEPFWGDGACSQLDVEPWEGYPRPVSADEVLEARDHHVRLLGREPFIYINPNQLPRQFAMLRAADPDFPLWLPNFSRSGQDAAAQLGAVCHQWTDEYACPGFAYGIDANEVRDVSTLDRLCGMEDTVRWTYHEPQRVIDTRGRKHPDGTPIPNGGGKLRAGQARRIPVVYGTHGLFVVGVVATQPGHLMVSSDGTFPDTTSLVNYAPNDPRNQSITLACPDGQVWVKAITDCDIYVDLYATGS